MDKAVLSWANQYYGKCMGLPAAPEEVLKDEEALKHSYASKFLKPICYIATGECKVPEDKSVLNRTVSLLGRGPITDWLYLLNFWVNNDYFTYTGDWQADYDRCVEKTRKETGVVFATASRTGKDFALHTIDRTTVDDIPYNVLYYPRALKPHLNGRILDDLCVKKPSLLTDQESAFLAVAISRKFISEEDLCSEVIMWPYNGGQEQRQIAINAVYPNRPPYDYFELCRNLAPAQLAEYPTQFLAVQQYSKSSPVSDSLRTWLDTIAGSGDLLGDVPSPSALNDDMIIDYLRENYGLACDNLSTLAVTPGAMFQQMVDIDPEVLDGSAQELLDAVLNNSNATSGTLDEIILNYCNERKISTKCTIEQLIAEIDEDIHPTPPTFIDTVANYISETNTSPDTTLEEVMQGVKHKFHDPIDDVMEFIETNEFYPTNVKDVLLHSIVEGTPVEWPDEKEIALNTIKNLKLPTELESRMTIAVQTQSPVELPEPEPAAEESAPVKMDDKGYVAGELLLRKTREAILKDSSPNVRLKYTQVLYSFLRLLMFDPKAETQEVAASISSRAGNSEGEVKELLEESVQILHG